jgi:hypothetical protein
MSEIVFQINIPSDDDGFVTLQCSFCNSRFKLTTADFQSDDVIYIFCPYCGLQNEGNDLLTDEVLEQVHTIAQNYMNSRVNEFMDGLEKSLRGNKHISFERGKKLGMEDDKVLFEREEMEIIQPTCCKRPVKTKPLEASLGIYCPFCGVK